MKIVILTEILSTHSGSRAPIELARYLALNNKVTLLAYDLQTDLNLKKELETKGIKIVLIHPPDFIFSKWFTAFKFLPYFKNQDIISFHGTLPALLVAKLSGIPIVKTYYGTQLNAYLERFLPFESISQKDKVLNWFGNNIILFMEKVSFLMVKQSVSISQYTAKEAHRYFGQKIPFIHLGASPLSNNQPSFVSPSADFGGAQPSTINHQPSVTLLTVSRITPYKGFHLLIDAIKKINKKVNLMIVGSSPQLKYLEYLKKIKTPQTEIMINVSDRKLACLYQTCDIYASCDRYLFFGLPPLEAGLREKPTVALDYCAAREIILHKKTGFVAKDLNEFSQYLKILINNPALRAKMGQEAKKLAVENFSWKKTAKNYESVFAKIIREK